MLSLFLDYTKDRLIEETKQVESQIRKEWPVVSNVGEQAKKIRTVACQVASKKQIALSKWVT